MSKTLFGLPQIAKLHEIQEARLKMGGRGIHAEVQELITRLTAGGVGPPDTADPFLRQSKVLWDKGWGRELGYKSLDACRKSLEQDGLPVTPERPQGLPDHLHCLVLWDQRPFRKEKEPFCLSKLCRLLGVVFNGDDHTFVQHEATSEITTSVRWVWCQDGRMNRNRKPSDCRTSFHAPEVGLEAIGGLFLYAQDREAIGPYHIMDLPGSVLRADPSGCACLLRLGDEPKLVWRWGDYADPGFGSGSRGE